MEQQTNKLIDAKKHGVRIIDETTLREMLEPLVGIEGLLLVTDPPLPCAIHSRLDVFCYMCRDSRLVCSVFIKDSLHYVETCKCKLKLTQYD